MHWMDIVVYEPLTEQLRDIDARLDAIEQEDFHIDPLWALDDCERQCGDGFIACQLYMIERKGEVPAALAYDCGPKHGPLHVAHILNTAGNYRKHRGEWPKDESLWGRTQHRTLGVFRDSGVTDSEFILWRLLSALTAPGPARFSSLLPRLVEWRDDLDRLTPTVVTAPSF